MAEVARRGIDVGRDDIGLHLVAEEIRASARVIDRVQHRKQRSGPRTFAKPGKGDDRPRRAMRILAAILADTGRISLYIAWIVRGPVEGWSKKQRQTVIFLYQFARDRRHGPLCAFGPGDARDYRPGLGDRIDPAFVARRGADRGAVVEPGPPVPIAVPGFALERLLKRRGMIAPFRRARGVAPRLRQWDEGGESHVQEPPEPHAFPPARLADPVHAVVPVPAADQREPVRAALEARVEGDRAMFVDTGHPVRDCGREEPVPFVFRQPRPFQERNELVEDRRIAARFEVMSGAEGEPYPVV